jgi:WD40 repeat protein
MKQEIIVLLLSAIATMFSASCKIVSAQAPETAPAEVTWEQLFYKNDLVRIEKAAFSPDGQRFLVSDGYDFVSLWKKPFLSSEREVPIEDSGPLLDLQFFSDQHNVFLAVDGGTAQIWDQELQNKKFAYKFPFSGRARRGTATEDGRFIALRCELYDRQKKSLIGRSVAHAVNTGISFGGSSLLLTSGYHDQRIAVRNIFSGELEYRRVPHPVTDGAISPNEKYAVAVTRKGRCYLWNWPEQEPKTLSIARENSFFGGFSPDSKWFAIRGTEFVHIFQTDPLDRIARLESDSKITAVHVASNNLVVIGDIEGNVQIFDVSAAKVIAKHKVLAHGVWPVELAVDKGFLWAASTRFYLEKGEKSEIALYRVGGLKPYIEPHNTAGINIDEKEKS